MKFKKVLPLFFVGAATIVLSSFTGISSGRSAGFAVADAAKTEGIQDVIAWFSTNDTLVYWLHETERQFADRDTVLALGFHTKVMMSVADSTEDGYRMQMRFVDFRVDTPSDRRLKTVVGMLSRRMLRALPVLSVDFVTDVTGRIVKVENVRQFRKNMKSALPGLEDLMPSRDSVYAGNPRINPLISGWISPDAISDSYLQALELLFQFHGRSFNIGEVETHEDGEKYSTDSYVEVTRDADSYEYEIYVKADNRIPGESPVYRSELDMKYFMDGWPEEAVSRESVVDAGEGAVVERRFVRAGK